MADNEKFIHDVAELAQKHFKESEVSKPIALTITKAGGAAKTESLGITVTGNITIFPPDGSVDTD